MHFVSKMRKKGYFLVLLLWVHFQRSFFVIKKIKEMREIASNKDYEDRKVNLRWKKISSKRLLRWCHFQTFNIFLIIKVNSSRTYSLPPVLLVLLFFFLLFVEIIFYGFIFQYYILFWNSLDPNLLYLYDTFHYIELYFMLLTIQSNFFFIGITLIYH